MSKLNIKGLNPRALLNNIDVATFESLTKQEQKYITSKVVQYAQINQARVRKAVEAGKLEITASFYTSGHQAKYSVKGKNTKASLKNEFIRVKNFFESDYSTITKARKAEKRIIEKIPQFKNRNKTQRSDFWSGVRKYFELHPEEVGNRITSPATLEKLAEAYENDPDNFNYYITGQKDLNEIYSDTYEDETADFETGDYDEEETLEDTIKRKEQEKTSNLDIYKSTLSDLTTAYKEARTKEEQDIILQTLRDILKYRK